MQERIKFIKHLLIEIFNFSQHVRQSILQFLTPLAMQHTLVFLAAVADVWNSLKLSNRDATPSAPCCSGQIGTGKHEKQWLASMNQRVLPLVTEEQQSLMEIVMAIKVTRYFS